MKARLVDSQETDDRGLGENPGPRFFFAIGQSRVRYPIRVRRGRLLETDLPRAIASETRTGITVNRVLLLESIR